MITQSDSTTTSPAASVQSVDPKIMKFINDLDADEKLAQEVYAAYKAKGASGAIAAAVPIVATIGNQIADAKAAIPALKDGIKTTEGIVSIAVAVGLPVLAHFSPDISQSAATTIDVVSGVVGALYVVSRSFLKQVHITATAQAVTAVATAASTASKP